ncbi:MAG: hypothetical protein K6G26_10455, partial [Lachnospiraceae bacterium]|nr:hypothetical protein [Lachnospiraceae bacterium]
MRNLIKKTIITTMATAALVVAFGVVPAAAAENNCCTEKTTVCTCINEKINTECVSKELCKYITKYAYTEMTLEEVIKEIGKENPCLCKYYKSSPTACKLVTKYNLGSIKVKDISKADVMWFINANKA